MVRTMQTAHACHSYTHARKASTIAFLGKHADSACMTLTHTHKHTRARVHIYIFVTADVGCACMCLRVCTCARAGDFWHHRETVPFNLLNLVKPKLLAFHEARVPLLMLVGNHDQV